MCKFCDDILIAWLIDVRDRWVDDYEHEDIAEGAEDKLKDLALYSEDVYDCNPNSNLHLVVDFMLTMYNGVTITGFKNETDRLEVGKNPNIKYCPHCGRKLD